MNVARARGPSDGPLRLASANARHDADATTAPDAERYSSERAVLQWRLARQALHLALADPDALGGVVLRGRHGPARSALLAELSHPGRVRRVPRDADEQALLGGIDTVATLAAARTVRRAGVLDAPPGTVLLLGGAERLSPAGSAAICAWLDAPSARSAMAPARASLVALDESIEHSGLVESALGERLALHVDVPELTLGGLAFATDGEVTGRPASAGAFPAPATVALPETILDELVRLAARLGIVSLRSVTLACRAARVAAALAGRHAVAVEDAELAVQLVLAPRARRLPDVAEPAPAEQPDERADERPGETPDATQAPPRPPSPDAAEMPSQPDAADTPDNTRPPPTGPLSERLVAATAAALPSDLLATLGAARVARGASIGRDAAARADAERSGRAIGARHPRGGARRRLDLIATLKAAIPYQRLREPFPDTRHRVATHVGTSSSDGPRLRLRREDFRVTRYRRATRTTTLFVVDASGSAAMHRLAEAKGAVENLLAECYVRRDRVALITFRGNEASLDLPPTRSLARARRALIGLPGGGGTPLAAGLDLAADTLERLAREGESPLGVFMSDARANIARDGSASRSAAQSDAERSARRIAGIGARTLFVDTAPRPRPIAARLAELMRAHYVPLPQLDTRLLAAGARHP